MESTNMPNAENTQKEPQENFRLDIDTGVLKGRKNSHVSLGDLYGIDIFTDEVLEKETQLKNEKSREFEMLEKSIFIATNSPKIDELSLKELLFTEKTDAIKKAEYASLKKDYSHYYVMGGAVITMLFLVSLIKYNQYRKKKRSEYVNYIDLENPRR